MGPRGTTVPLEQRCVRFLDNFSAGNRGASSAEHFLEQGYAVVFLHRANSQLPFEARCTGMTGSARCFLMQLSGRSVVYASNTSGYHLQATCGCASNGHLIMSARLSAKPQAVEADVPLLRRVLTAAAAAGARHLPEPPERV